MTYNKKINAVLSNINIVYKNDTDGHNTYNFLLLSN